MDGLLELMISSAFLVGLTGGVHCAGMCGGIVGAVSAPWSNKNASWVFHLAYNSGRIASYGAAGALAGGLGSAGLLFRDAVPLQHTFLLLASLMLLGLGLYLAGIAPFMRRIEALGGFVWRRIQPYSHHFLPVDSAPRALGLGALWGWLPCGLVYTMLLTALAAADPAAGSLVMLAFGLGTLPNLLVLGFFFVHFKTLAQSRAARVSAGALVASFGGYGLLKLFDGVALTPGGLICHFLG
jgi:sulfite exporter TauE/SafE